MSNKNNAYAGSNKLGGGLCLLIVCAVIYEFNILNEKISLVVLIPFLLIGVALYTSGFRGILKDKGYRNPLLLSLALANLAGVIILALLPDKSQGS
jgi:hypothetical protein